MTKIPVDPASGEFASTTDPATWGAFETARDRATSPTTDAVGVGVVFAADDPIVGVDLDDCRIPETAKTREWASDIVDRLDSFTEISPSGTGYHVPVTGANSGLGFKATGAFAANGATVIRSRANVRRVKTDWFRNPKRVSER